MSLAGTLHNPVRCFNSCSYLLRFRKIFLKCTIKIDDRELLWGSGSLSVVSIGGDGVGLAGVLYIFGKEKRSTWLGGSFRNEIFSNTVMHEMSIALSIVEA
ncbi:MAG: hypothetical protein WCP33_04980, partial [Deltaproteobacteria bacterium]